MEPRLEDRADGRRRLMPAGLRARMTTRPRRNAHRHRDAACDLAQWNGIMVFLACSVALRIASGTSRPARTVADRPLPVADHHDRRKPKRLPPFTTLATH